MKTLLFILALTALGKIQAQSVRQKLVNTWVLMTKSVNGQSVAVNMDSTKTVFKFNVNGNIDTKINGVDKKQARYKLEGNIVTIFFEEGPLALKVEKVTGKTLALSGDRSYYIFIKGND